MTADEMFADFYKRCLADVTMSHRPSQTLLLLVSVSLCQHLRLKLEMRHSKSHGTRCVRSSVVVVLVMHHDSVVIEQRPHGQIEWMKHTWRIATIV